MRSARQIMGPSARICTLLARLWDKIFSLIVGGRKNTIRRNRKSYDARLDIDRAPHIRGKAVSRISQASCCFIVSKSTAQALYNRILPGRLDPSLAVQRLVAAIELHLTDFAVGSSRLLD